MSFTNNIYGGVPQNELVFSTSNVVSTNASFVNLDATNANITNLTTVTWSQPNINASTIVTADLTATNASIVDLDVSGELNVSTFNIANINISELVLDQADVKTLRFDDITNTNYGVAQRDNDILTIAGGYVDPSGTAFAGDIVVTPYDISNASQPLVVRASDGKVSIPNLLSSNISATDINASNINSSTIDVGTVSSTTSNSSQINASNVSIDDGLNVNGNIITPLIYTHEFLFTDPTATTVNSRFVSSTTSGEDQYLLGNQDYAITGLGGTTFLFCDNTLNNTNISNLLADNISVTDLAAKNLSADNLSVTADITTPAATITSLTCDLTPNLTAGNGINITTVGNKPVIAVTDPLSITKLNASNISVNQNISVGANADITGNLDVNGYFSYKPRFIALYRDSNLALTGTQQGAPFNKTQNANSGGEFNRSGGDVQVTTGGWYRVSWGLGFQKTSDPGGDRIGIRVYTRTRTNSGSFTFDAATGTIGSSVYLRKSNLVRQQYAAGMVLIYIPANGWVQLTIDAMLQASTTWTSSFNGTGILASSRFCVEYVSNSPET